jgi:ATP-dependent DNA ligase
MLLRSGGIPCGDGWAFELKDDGFRAIVSTEDGLQVRSRRGWNMSDRLSELSELPPGLVLDGELVAFNEHGAPHWPLAERGAARPRLRIDQSDSSGLMTTVRMRSRPGVAHGCR